MSRPPLHRPILLPGLPRIWRGTRILQIGLNPARAVLLEFPSPATAKVLDLLDGTRPERAVLRAASRLDLSLVEVRALLDVLHEAGLVISTQALYPPALDAATRRLLSSEAAALALAAQAARPLPDALPASEATNDHRPSVQERSPAQSCPEDQQRSPHSPPAEPNRTPLLAPASILRRRRSAKVVVTGRGRLGAGIAVGLAEAGIGHVHADLPGTVSHVERIGGPLRDVEAGTLRTEEVIKAIRRASPSTETRSIRRGKASLVVQLCHDEPVALLAYAHLQHRQPYLSVAVREGTAVIGPLVPAGGRPCLNCLALFRQNYEQGELPEFGTTGDEPLAVATVLAASGYAIAEVLNFVDGVSAGTLGAEVEVAGPGLVRRRQWKPHPYCTCGVARRRH